MSLTLQHKQANTEALDHIVSKEHVAGKFDMSVSELDSLLGSAAWPNLNYRIMQDQERDDVMLGILQRIDEGKMRVVGGDDNAVWIKGWGEILEHVEKNGFSPDILRPQYFDHHRIMRFDGEYIDGGDANFVYEYDQLLRRLTLSKYLKGQTKVVELGCGTGTSQLMLADILPEAELIASDWSPPSQGIVNAIADYKKRKIKPVCFNMLTLEGWDELEIDSQSAILTVHALEQLGGNCGALMEKLLAAKPKLCVHLEPVEEFYEDDKTLFDYLGQKFHTTRNYLQGWLSALIQHEQAGKVEIIDTRRLAFGDRYHEAYNVICWKPL